MKTIFDKGNYGEFLTFAYLEKLDGHHRLMTNLYIPKKDGSTTEIDLIMLSQTGIYVFESKNYGGWIFGDESSKNWMQILENKQKNQFFSPVWQNKGHISALKSAIELDNDSLYKSYIIFSERCTLKNIKVTSPSVKVIKRNALIKTIKKDIESSSNLMTIEEVDQLYLKLQRYARADETVKKAHIDNVQTKKF
ncbi:NERD domain-containing protein [Metallumcola ferriviriculae]|uniref:NERD domain-containing protein n=1 Tax=Metallumcola ferriviriculae TaxID=3039180 RepID=A0AAU0UNH3_9FIRM|nr:NERD domain-containing protein [Desulfitibacteraceae bacterium MK1]